MKIDHVTLATSDLEATRQRFAELGLATDYGGPHSNGATHMALLGFDDGSYLELISTLEPGVSSPLWGLQIREDAGPTAWAIAVDDIAREKERLARIGVAADGPVPMTRVRPDGTTLAWELLFPGDTAPGAMLPFAIADRTPRDLRVAPSASVRGSELGGVAGVVLAVGSIDEAAALFRRAYGWSAPLLGSIEGLGARVACFEGTPVSLAEPSAESAWLTERVARYGETPAAFLLTSSDLKRSADRFPLLAPEPWFGRTLAWINPGRLFGWRLGLLWLTG